MAGKLTKAQQKRMVREIMAKTQKLFFSGARRTDFSTSAVVNGSDMNAIEKMCAKWMKRIG